jgi:DNA-directed RNA polymerase specialized sigma24 family protein
MADSKDTDDFAELCARLVEHARSVGGPPPADLFTKLYPHLVPQIRKHARRMPPPTGSGVSPEDIVQEVLNRLARGGLSRPPEGHEPEATVRSWIKTTTTRYLIDLYRKWDKRHADVEQLPAGEGVAEERVPIWSRLGLEEALACLDERYPIGARLLRELCQEPDAPASEIARRMGVSVVYAYKIRSLMLQVLADCFAEPPASERRRK